MSGLCLSRRRFTQLTLVLAFCASTVFAGDAASSDAPAAIRTPVSPGPLVSTSRGDAPNRVPADEAVSFTPTWTVGGWAEAVALRGDTVFAGFGPNLVTIDFSDAASPRPIGGLARSAGTIRRLYIVGDSLYVVDDLDGLRIVDVADPASPREVWTQGDQAVHDVAVEGKLAYVIGAAGLSVYDLGAPGGGGSGEPSLVGSVDTPGDGRAVEVRAGRAYVADDAGGLRVYDVSEPTAIREIGSLDIFGASDVAVSGEIAYVPAYSVLHVVDVADPGAMRAVGSYKYPDYEVVLRVSLDGDRAFVGTQGHGLQILDVSSPATPVLDYSLDPGYPECSGGDAAAATAAAGPGGLVFAAMLEGGVMALSQRTAPDLDIVGQFAPPLACAQYVAAARGYVYATSGTRRLEVIDARGPGPGTVVATVPVTDVRALALESGRLYVAGSGQVDLWDVTMPARPTALGTWEGAGRSVGDVVVAGGLMYVTTSDGLSMVDVGDPSQPREIGVLPSAGEAVSEVAVSQGYAYVIGNGQLRVADVSAPGAPRWLGSVALSEYLFDVQVVGHLALAVDPWYDQLHVVDVTNPEAPMIRSSHGVDAANARLTVMDQVALVAGGRVLAYDLEDAAAPAESGRADLGLLTRDLAAMSGSLYVANGSHGVLALRLDSATSGAWAVLLDLAARYEADPISCPREPTRVAGVYAYRCQVAAGHQFAVALEPFGTAAAAETAWQALRRDEPWQIFQGHKSFARQVDDSASPDLPMRHRFHVWQADRWLVTVESFDDTGIALGPAPLELSEVLFASGVSAGLWVRGGEKEPGGALYLPYAFRPGSPTIERVAQVGGATLAVAFAGHHAYLGSGTRVLAIDVSDESAPRVTGQSDVLPGVVRHIDVMDGYLFVSVDPDGGRGPFVLADTTPAHLPMVADYAAGARDVSIRGRLAFVAAGSAGLLIYDLADPMQPVRIGQHEGQWAALQVAAGDRYVAVAEALGDDDFVYQIIDVTDPSRPTDVTTVQRAHVSDAAFVGDLLYVVDSNGLAVHAAPGFETTALLEEAAGTTIAVSEDHAFVSGIALDDGGPVAVVDLSDPRAPVRIDSCDPGAGEPCGRWGAASLVAAPGWVFASGTRSGEAGLSVIGVGDPLRPTITGSLALIGRTQGPPELWESALFLGDTDADAIRILDVGSIDDPVLTAPSIGQAGDGLVVRQGFAYRASYWMPALEGTLEEWDVRSPTHPLALAPLRWPDGQKLHALAPSGGALLVGASHYPSPLGQADVSYVTAVADAWSTAPRVAATLGPFEGSVRGLAASEGYGYLVSAVGGWTDSGWVVHGELYVLDVREPASAAVVGQLTLQGEPDAPDFCGGMLFVAPVSPSAGEAVIDVRDPARPRLVARLAGAYSRGWACQDHTAFAVDGNALHLLDLGAVPPREVTSYLGLQDPSGMVGDGHHLYVADGAGGLVILQFTLP